MPIELHSSLSDLRDRYDGFLVDLWGVIHDGITPYPEAFSCLAALKREGKPVIFLSNAPRRSARVTALLSEMKLDSSLYLEAISSGEVCYRWFSNSKITELMGPLEKHYYYIGPDKDKDLLDGLPYTMTEHPKEASFAITTGFDHDQSTLEEKRPQLEAALRYGLQMICVNPDKVIIRRTGEYALCAGVIAEAYHAMGGKVHYFGKPYSAVYEECTKILKSNGINRVAAIGDSLETDIKGANDFGLDSVLVTGGILSKHLGTSFGTLPSESSLQEVCAKESIFPRLAIPAFRW